MAHIAGSSSDAAFWTACPHCSYVHSYPRLYVGRRLRCPTPACRRGFSADELPCAPPIVPGADMYFCTWGFFPLGPPTVAQGWAPFIPFNPARHPSPVHSPTPPPAAATPARVRPTARKKVGACLKGRARVEAEEEEEPVILEDEAEAQADWLGEKDASGNDNFNLSELGFNPEEIDALHRDAVIDAEMKGCAF